MQPVAFNTIFNDYDTLCSFDPMVANDRWILEELRIDVNIQLHQKESSYYLFESIPEGPMLNAVKIYLYYRLMVGTKCTTVYHDLRRLARFARYCARSLESQSFADVRMQEATAYIDSLRFSGSVGHDLNGHITAIRSFADISCLLGIPGGLPTRRILPKHVRVKENGKNPNPYSQDEIERMMQHVDRLDPVLRRMLYILVSIPIRYSEIQGMRASQVIESEEGFSLLVHMFKSNELKTVPIPDAVGALLKGQIKDPVFLCVPQRRHRFANSFYDEANPLLFLTSDGRDIDDKRFNRSLSDYFASCDIRSDSGGLLASSTRRFRAYTTSKLISQGVDPVIVSMLLGHKSAHSLRNYAKIFPEKAHKALKPVLDDRDWHILNMGSIMEKRRVKEECTHGLKLTIGTCARPIEQGICKHANACYGCIFFIPRVEDKEKYLVQLANARNDLSYAKAEGLERLVESNEELITQIESILKRIG